MIQHLCKSVCFFLRVKEDHVALCVCSYITCYFTCLSTFISECLQCFYRLFHYNYNKGLKKTRIVQRFSQESDNKVKNLCSVPIKRQLGCVLTGAQVCVHQSSGVC